MKGISARGYVYCTAACRESVLGDMYIVQQLAGNECYRICTLYSSMQGISARGYVHYTAACKESMLGNM